VEPVAETIQALLKRPSIPSHMSPDILDELPDSPGVYRFHGENDVLLYVGKSTNIRQRVASHFSGDHNSSRGVQLSQSMRWVDWTETAGELGALLLELKQIKGLRPLYNRRSRAAKRLVTIALNPGTMGIFGRRCSGVLIPTIWASTTGCSGVSGMHRRRCRGLLRRMSSVIRCWGWSRPREPVSSVGWGGARGLRGAGGCDTV